MKKIWGYLKNYFTVDFNPYYFFTVFILMGIAVWYEYTNNFNLIHIESDYKKPVYFIKNMLLYAVPYLGCIMLYIIFSKRWELLKNTEMWGLGILILLIYSFRCHFYWHKDIIYQNFPKTQYIFWVKSLNQLIYGALLFIPISVFWYIKDRKNQNLYGWKIKGVDLKPYFTMLLIMVPLIGWASTQSDFQHSYPVAGNFRGLPENNILKWGFYLFFEIVYGLDFMMNEYFFRGFMILAMAKFLGKEAILPMVCMYVFIHFGKPAGETISSFFGGLILGILALETKSIAGGFIAHLGVAYLMEIGGALGRGFFPNP